MPKNKLYYASALKFLWQLVKPNRFLYFIPSAIALLLVGVGLVQTRLTQSLIDSAVAGELGSILQNFLLFLGAIVLNVGLNYGSSLCVAKLDAKCGLRLKNQIAHTLLYANYSDIQKLRAGNTLQTLNADTEVVCQFLGRDLMALFAQFTMAIGGLLYIVWVNPLLALITFLYTPLGMFFTLSLNKKMNRIYPLKADREGQAMSVAEQIFSAIPVVKSFVAEERMRQKLAAEFAVICETDISLAKWNALMQPACSSTSMVPRIFYLIAGGFMVMNGSLSIGMLLSVFDLLNFIIGPTVYMPFLLNGLNRSIASMNRIEKLTGLPLAASTVIAGGCPVPEIKLENLSYSYESGAPIIKELSWAHRGPGIIALCGPSGSGKTTLLDLIGRLYPPSSGCVETAGAISTLNQESFLFGGTIRDNLLSAKPDAAEAEIARALDLAGVDSFGTADSSAQELSGGQKQRVALARLILADTPIWLLDEPTSALDSDTEQLILDTIKGAAEKKLILMAAHRAALIALAERRLEL